MPVELPQTITQHPFTIESEHLARIVKADAYLPPVLNQNTSLLLINDGQDLLNMPFTKILSGLPDFEAMNLMCIGIHCGTDRKNEYGVASQTDYKGRGAKAPLHNRFVFEELLPYIREKFNIPSFKQKAYAGFSLGGLYAMDIVWSNPAEFTIAGVFSGSFWWRSVAQEDEDFDEEQHRIMHQIVRAGTYHPWQRYFFEVGTLDEIADRNQNGIIDSIDDTLALIAELKAKGCADENIRYLELADGRHDVETWARAFPAFLTWAFGK